MLVEVRPVSKSVVAGAADPQSRRVPDEHPGVLFFLGPPVTAR